ncbi:bleomycin resistance family protein [Fulvivirga sp. M361]|uniref:VOC family protein n=1 Tax=Fulvivirga sp. M361 TaxID=2594266 RepID=UPI00117B8136|nr:VOC family protein [Fulvivirga sp. M361]TRX52054.1 bleomycin resistance family protein [Fulvivirga sp. M361]
MKILKLTPNFEVKSVEETVAFYQSVLGFSLVMAVPDTQDGIEQVISKDKNYVYALVKKDEVEMMFQHTESFRQDLHFAKSNVMGASVSFYMEVDHIEELHAFVQEKVKKVTRLKTTWYGMKEFYFKDINDYILGFAQKAK